MMTTYPVAASASADSAIDCIKSEHRALASVLGAMQALVSSYRQMSAPPDYELFDSMLSYVENVPDQLHHPKEDRVLFAAVTRRADRAKALVENLECEHAQGAPMLSELRRALHAFRDGAPNALNELATTVDDFADFYWSHMRREEQVLLPLAIEVLTADDWHRIASAFGDNGDPLASTDLATKYRQLYLRIIELTPPPLKSLLEGGVPAS